MTAMSNDPKLVGSHRCRLCGTRWRCNNAACADGDNTTLLCLRCDAAKAEGELTRAKSFYQDAKRRGMQVETARERLQSATARADAMRASMENVYGGFTA